MILLSDMIRSLREELSKAQEEGKDSDFKFSFDSVELELSVVISTTTGGQAGVKFWVVEAGGDYQKENSYTHKFKLLLKPGSKTSSLLTNQTEMRISKD